MKRFIEKNNYNLIFVILYRLAIDWIYFNIIHTSFGAQFVDNRDVKHLIVSWIILLFFYVMIKFLIKNHQDNISSIIVVSLYMISLVPFTSCVYSGISSDGFTIYNSIFWMLIFLFMWLSYHIPSKITYKCGGYISMNKTVILKVICVFTLLLILYVSWRYAHFRIVTDLYDVYGVRLEAANYNYSTVMSYLLSWTVGIIPILVGYFFIKKKYIWTFICLIVYLFRFGIDGRKSIFFMPIIVIAFLVIYKGESIKIMNKIIVIGICLMSIIAIVEMYFIGSNYIIDLGIRRMMYVPNQLGQMYYDFFTNNTPDYFRSSFLRHFGFSSPYTMGGLKGFTYLIGDKYFGDPDMNCNNGLSSDALANMGMIGCIIMPIFYVVFLRILDRCSKNVDKRLCFVVAVYVIYNILSTTLTTSLMTHGILAILLVLPLLRNNNDEKKYKKIAAQVD